VPVHELCQAANFSGGNHREVIGVGCPQSNVLAKTAIEQQGVLFNIPDIAPQISRVELS
jgi:hypothetical protein